MAVAQNQRTPGQSVINIRVSIDIKNARAVTASNIKGNRGLGPEWTAYTAYKRLLRSLQHLPRFCPFHFCCFQLGPLLKVDMASLKSDFNNVLNQLVIDLEGRFYARLLNGNWNAAAVLDDGQR